jgi:hypothetical protein
LIAIAAFVVGVLVSGDSGQREAADRFVAAWAA